MRGYVLDASAVMALLGDEPGAGAVEEILRKASDGRQALWMSVVNWGEVYHSMWRKQGEVAAEEALLALSQVPMEIVGVDPAAAKAAARLKAQHGLPYADAFAAALALQRKAAIVTTDSDFERVEKDVTVVWAQKG